MKKLTVVTIMLSLAVQGVASAQPKKPSKLMVQSSANQTYLNILDQALAVGAPDYLNVSAEDKLSYGHYACQALNSKTSMDTMFVTYMQSVARDVSPEMQFQAEFFLGSSMSAGVRTFCPKHLPQVQSWLQKFMKQQSGASQ